MQPFSIFCLEDVHLEYYEIPEKNFYEYYDSGQCLGDARP